MSELSEKQVEVKDAAAGLSERIERAQEFISTLAGRIEAETVRDYTDATNRRGEFRLAVWRVGKGWTLHCAFGSPGEALEYKKLQDASIKMKVFALGMIPDLIDAMLANQSELLKQIKAANDEFDRWLGKPNKRNESEVVE